MNRTTAKNAAEAKPTVRGCDWRVGLRVPSFGFAVKGSGFLDLEFRGLEYALLMLETTHGVVLCDAFGQEIRGTMVRG